MNRPKYNRCDSCGRNAHKVAVRIVRAFPNPTVVEGYCPSCWNADYRFSVRDRLESSVASGRTLRYEVIYDLRRR